jgi:hypothetical protein
VDVLDGGSDLSTSLKYRAREKERTSGRRGWVGAGWGRESNSPLTVRPPLESVQRSRDFKLFEVVVAKQFDPP